MDKLTIIIALQTILNFIALNQILFHWIPNYWIPDGVLGMIVAFILWGIILIFSYALAVRFNNREGE